MCWDSLLLKLFCDMIVDYFLAYYLASQKCLMLFACAPGTDWCGKMVVKVWLCRTGECVPGRKEGNEGQGIQWGGLQIAAYVATISAKHI